MRQEAVRRAQARQAQWREERSATQVTKRLKGTGYSSLEEVDDNWSRFGFVPKPGAAVSGAAGPGAAAGPSQLP